MRQKIYLVKKDPSATGNNIEWRQLTREQFTAFTKSPAGKGRYFVRLTDDIDYECPEIFIEATYEDYRKWKAGYNRHQYLKEQAEEYEVVSASTPVAEGISLLDALADDSASVEEEMLSLDEKHRLRLAVKQLPANDQRLVELLYFQERPKPLAEMLEEMNLKTHQALYKRKKKVLKKIFDLLVADYEKSQQ